MTTQNLYTKLKQAKSEEDVKDIYIQALGQNESELIEKLNLMEQK